MPYLKGFLNSISRVVRPVRVSTNIAPRADFIEPLEGRIVFDGSIAPTPTGIQITGNAPVNFSIWGKAPTSSNIVIATNADGTPAANAVHPTAQAVATANTTATKAATPAQGVPNPPPSGQPVQTQQVNTPEPAELSLLALAGLLALRRRNRKTPIKE
jgi:hypothetical protein